MDDTSLFMLFSFLLIVGCFVVVFCCVSWSWYPDGFASVGVLESVEVRGSDTFVTIDGRDYVCDMSYVDVGLVGERVIFAAYNASWWGAYRSEYPVCTSFLQSFVECYGVLNYVQTGNDVVLKIDGVTLNVASVEVINCDSAQELLNELVYCRIELTLPRSIYRGFLTEDMCGFGGVVLQKFDGGA